MAKVYITYVYDLEPMENETADKLECYVLDNERSLERFVERIWVEDISSND